MHVAVSCGPHPMRDTQTRMHMSTLGHENIWAHESTCKQPLLARPPVYPLTLSSFMYGSPSNEASSTAATAAAVLPPAATAGIPACALCARACLLLAAPTTAADAGPACGAEAPATCAAAPGMRLVLLMEASATKGGSFGLLGALWSGPVSAEVASVPAACMLFFTGLCAKQCRTFSEELHEARRHSTGSGS